MTNTNDSPAQRAWEAWAEKNGLSPQGHYTQKRIFTDGFTAARAPEQEAAIKGLVEATQTLVTWYPTMAAKWGADADAQAVKDALAALTRARLSGLSKE